MSIDVVSCNVNGLRAAEKKGFFDWMAKRRPQVAGLQEVRATQKQLSPTARAPEGYCAHFSEAERAGYSGVGLYLSEQLQGPEFIVPSLDQVKRDVAALHNIPVQNDSFDAEGRIVGAELGPLFIVNAYFPNGNGKDRDNSRVPYKLDFYERLRAYLEPLRKQGKKLLVMGDWNTAHRAVDLARPKQNEKTSGFLPEERVALDLWLENGWVDTFRHLHPAPTDDEIQQLVAQAKKAGKKKAERELHSGEGHYSWWSQRGAARANNVGWRIDYILASQNVMEHLKSATIHKEVFVSDHCPISIELRDDVLDPA